MISKRTSARPETSARVVETIRPKVYENDLPDPWHDLAIAWGGVARLANALDVTANTVWRWAHATRVSEALKVRVYRKLRKLGWPHSPFDLPPDGVWPAVVAPGADRWVHDAPVRVNPRGPKCSTCGVLIAIHDTHGCANLVQGET